MNLRTFFSLLRDELRCTTNDLTFAYASRAGVPSPLGRSVPARAEGEGAHLERAGSDASPRVAPRHGVPRPNPMAADCLYSREGMACRLLPDLGRELWCVNCLAYVARNPSTPNRCSDD